MRALCAGWRPRRERPLYPDPPGIDELVRVSPVPRNVIVALTAPRARQRGQVPDEAPRTAPPRRRRPHDQLASRRRLVRPTSPSALVPLTHPLFLQAPPGHHRHHARV